MSKVPENILAAVNALLAPYGEKYGVSATSTEGFLNIRDAAKFIGLSRMSLFRLVRLGKLKAIKLGESRNARLVFSIVDLVNFVESHK